MATNIRYCYRNLLDNTNTSLSSSSQVTTLPVQNIINPLKSIPMRTTGFDFEYIDIDLAQNLEVKAFALTGHNFSDDALINLIADDSETFYVDIDNDHTGFWKFCGNGEGSTANENDLTASGIATANYSVGRQDMTVLLNGTDEFYSILHADAGDFDFSGADDLSFDAWIMIEEGSRINPIISKWSETAGYYLLVNASNKLSFSASDGTYTDTITGDTELVTDTWYHVAVTADRDGNLALYLDGATDASAIAMTTGSLSNTNDFYIGRKDTDYFSGSLANVTASAVSRNSDYISDAAQTPKYIQSVVNDPRILMEFFSPKYYRYWRILISDTANSNSYLDIGRVYLGDYFEPERNYHGNWLRRIVDPSSLTVTKNNYEFSDLRDPYIEIDLRFPKEVQIKQSDITEYDEMFQSIGKSSRLFIALDYENHPQDWSYYGTLTGEFSMAHLTGTGHSDGRWTINNLKFKESR